MSGADESAVAALLDELDGLRKGVSLPPLGASTAQLYEAMLSVRTRLDRAEEILSTVVRVRGHVGRQLSAAKYAYEDAWDSAARTRKRGASALTSDFTAARERYADINAETIEQVQALRAAERRASYLSDAEQAARLAHRGLDALRSDLLALIRLLSFESHLER